MNLFEARRRGQKYTTTVFDPENRYGELIRGGKLIIARADVHRDLDAPVTALAVAPDNRTLVAGDSAGGLHVFEFVER